MINFSFVFKRRSEIEITKIRTFYNCVMCMFLSCWDESMIAKDFLIFYSMLKILREYMALNIIKILNQWGLRI